MAKNLILPIIDGKGFTRAEIELLQEMDPDIMLLADGSYTINGEVPEQIESRYESLMKELVDTLTRGPELRLIAGKHTKSRKKV